MTKHGFRLSVATIAVSVGLAACGGGSTAPASPAGAGSASDPGSPAASSGSTAAGCTLLSAADVSAALGGQLTDSTRAGTGICTFDSTDHVKGLALSTYENRKAMALFLDNEAGTDHIADLGDSAYWLPNGTVFVRKGDRGFSLIATGVLSPTDPSVNDALKVTLVGLAKIVIAKF